MRVSENREVQVRPACEQLPDGRAYLNPGAFLDGYRYAIVTKDGIEMRTFTESGC